MKKNVSRHIGQALFRVRGSDDRLRVMLIVPNPKKKTSSGYKGQDEYYVCHTTKAEWQMVLRFQTLVFLTWIRNELSNRQEVKNGTTVQKILCVIESHCFVSE